jgi:CHAT domain-containing protein
VYPRWHLPKGLIPSLFRVVKILILKAAIRYSTAFTAIAILLIAADSLAFRQDERGRNEQHSSGAATKAEDLFQEALVLSDTQESAAVRLRLQQATHLWVGMREPGKAASAALQMGDHYRRAREYREALDYYNQALEVRSLPAAMRVNALNAIAMVYVELYRGDLATHYFSQALNQARLINDLPAQTLALTGMANLHRQQGRKTQTLSCIAQARQLNRQRDRETEAALLCLLGQIKQEEGSVEKATGAFEDALSIYEKAGNTAGQVKTLCALSTLSLLASQRQAALKQAEKAVELAERQGTRAVYRADYVNARDLQWRAWLSRARAERALGEKERALKSYFWVRGHFTAMWWESYIATEASAIAFREEGQAAYREYVDLLVEQGKFKEAYLRADEAKARTILNRIAARRATPPSGDSNQEAALRDLFRSVARRRLELLDPNISSQQQANLQKAIDDEEDKIQEARLKNDMAHSRERLVWSQLASAEQLQKKTVQDRMALAEFLLGEDRSFVWLFAHGEVFSATLPPRKEIEKAVKSYLDLLANPPNPVYIERDLAKVRARAEALFATLLGPLGKQIEPDQRLIVVPDGLLNYLPFEGLIDNKHFLVETHEISYIPSASMLNLWQDSASRASSPEQMELFAVGDPLFELQAKAVGGKELAKVLNHRMRRATAARSFQLPPLPRTRDEVQYIAGLFPAGRCKVLLGSQGTEAAVKRESLRRYRRLHFATHSMIDDKSPQRSAVVLTAGDEEDGFLEVDEISDLDLDCELVVLSACQTGRGQLLSGEGIVGLTRAFLYAGARSVVVSLWSVSDISTGQLMKNFYQHLAGNLGNVSALRSAKLQMLRSEDVTRHPYYWASFISVGKP